MSYDGSMEEALCSSSPLHLVSQMPRIPYTVFHCDADAAVNIERHSARFAEAMRPSHEITLVRVANRGHGDLSPEAKAEYKQRILAAFL